MSPYRIVLLYRDPMLMHSYAMDSAKDNFNDVKIIVREMARQFSGNLLTHDWWNEAWVSEAMAVLFEQFVVNEVNQSQTEFVFYNFDSALNCF